MMFTYNLCSFYNKVIILLLTISLNKYFLFTRVNSLNCFVKIEIVNNYFATNFNLIFKYWNSY